MVNVKFDDNFQRAVLKVKDQEIQKSIKNKIRKIIADPEIGKPMRNIRKGTREVYIGGGSFRISYNYYIEQNLIEFLDFYHKDEQ